MNNRVMLSDLPGDAHRCMRRRGPAHRRRPALLSVVQGEPEAFAEKTGKTDVRGAYGLQGREMIAWLTHLQHTRGKNVSFVGILDERVDDFNRRVFSPQIERLKDRPELPGIVDEVITMAQITARTARGAAPSCATRSTPWKYPARTAAAGSTRSRSRTSDG